MNKTFFEKIRFRYKISILNENTLGEVWYIRLSRLQSFLLAFLVLVVIFVLYTFLIVKTPLRKLTPEYQDSEIRNELIAEYIRTDSILAEVRMRDEYIDALKSLIQGNIKIDSVVPIDSIALKERERTFIEKSKREKDFVQEFENNEKYNLSASDLQTKNDNRSLLLYPPVHGVVKEKFHLNRHYGIDIDVLPNAGVASVGEGTVIFCGYTIDEGYVIQVQHKDNLVSIYKNTVKLLKRTGDNVKGGEAIAIMGDAKDARLHFELWQDGAPLNPEKYILF